MHAMGLEAGVIKGAIEVQDLALALTRFVFKNDLCLRIFETIFYFVAHYENPSLCPFKPPKFSQSIKLKSLNLLPSRLYSFTLLWIFYQHKWIVATYGAGV